MAKNSVILKKTFQFLFIWDTGHYMFISRVMFHHKTSLNMERYLNDGNLNCSIILKALLDLYIYPDLIGKILKNTEGQL